MKYLKFSGKLSIVLILSILLGLVLLSLSFALPVDLMEDNAEKSGITLAIEGSYPLKHEGMITSKVDNWVNTLMINTAIYDGERDFLDKVMNAYTVRFLDENLIFSLVHYFSDDNTGEIHEPYTRYWHGYLIFLKPLLLLFDVNEIQTLNLIMMTLLILSVIYAFYKTDKKEYIIPYLASMLFLFPTVFYKVMLYYGIFYLTNIAILLILFKHKWLTENNRYCYFFFIIGIIACYVDILSFPVLSLGLPLCVYFIQANLSTIKEVLQKFFSFSILWSLGFSLMWAGKWIIASIYEGNLKPLYEAVASLTERSGTLDYITGNTFSRFDAITMNLSSVSDTYYNIVLVVSIIALMIYCLIIKGSNLNVEFEPVYIGFLGIAVMPLVWYFLTANHSYIHQFYTCKLFAGSVFAIFSAFVLFLNAQPTGAKQTKNKQKEKVYRNLKNTEKAKSGKNNKVRHS